MQYIVSLTGSLIKGALRALAELAGRGVLSSTRFPPGQRAESLDRQIYRITVKISMQMLSLVFVAGRRFPDEVLPADSVRIG
jgi:hypothetical protein